MQFVYPGVLFGLLAISIPIIIHLFHFRRFKKIYFSDVSLLQQLSDQSKKQSRLKHLLVLAARILAIAFLVLAFAKPFIPSDQSMVSLEGNSVSVFVDNSFSMEGISRRGRLVDEAVAVAREIAAAYQSTDRFMLLTNDLEGRHQQFVSREEFLELLDEVDLSPAVKTIGEVIVLKNELFSNAPYAGQSSYYISDFQKNFMVLGEVIPEDKIRTSLIPLQSQMPGNLYIDSCWIESPVRLVNQPIRILVRIKNFGNKALENQSLKLFVNNQQRSIATFSIESMGEREIALSWTVMEPGPQNGRVELVDYPITFDDIFYFSFDITPRIPVLSIDGHSQDAFIKALFTVDTLFAFSSMPFFAIDVSQFGRNNLLVFNGLNEITPGLASEVKSFLEQGGNLAMFPGQNVNFKSYNSFLESIGADLLNDVDTVTYNVVALNDQHPLFSGVFDKIPDNLDLPVSSKHYVISRSTRSRGLPLMVLQNGNHLVSTYKIGRGKLFLCAVGLDDSFGNFHRHPLFVPTVANMALQNNNFKPIFHIIGDDNPVVVFGSNLKRDEVIVIKGDHQELIPEQRVSGNIAQLFARDHIEIAGNYKLMKGTGIIGSVSFNYDRRESVPEFFSKSQLESLFEEINIDNFKLIESATGTITTEITGANSGKQLWKFFIILALVFLLCEVLLLRFFK